jgi:hypothetical protein
MSRTAFLRLEWLLSAALVVLSLAWSALRDVPVAARLVPSASLIVGGVIAGAALWGTIPLLLRTPSMQRVWREILQPFSAGLTTRDMVVIAALSGVTEELFFRGILLPELGLVTSSLCFGALHALCAVYFAWATAVGAGMSALTLASGSLLTPMIAHATYNLGALLLVRRSAQRLAVPTVTAAVDSTIASPHGIG